MSAATGAVQAAWQSALAAEHQAIFGYDVLGPRLGRLDQPLAHRCQDAHRGVRDAVEAAMVEHGVDPSAQRADYPALYPVSGASAAVRLAVRLEDACAGAWRYLYLQSASSKATPPLPTALPAPSAPLVTVLRRVAQEQLTASAVRGTRWRALSTPDRATVAFPGL